jgi:hypothetical protein
MVDCSEPNYRTDEQLQALLARSGKCAPTGPSDQIQWLSANLQTVIGLVDDAAQGERLKKIMAGFHVPPIKETIETGKSFDGRLMGTPETTPLSATMEIVGSRP